MGSFPSHTQLNISYCYIFTHRRKSQMFSNHMVMNLNFSVRLVGGHQLSEGRVEIRHQGIWGTVCDDLWDNVDASVVCRQLGYQAGTALVDNEFGEGWEYPILLDGVACEGSENSLEECGHEPWGQNDCTHREDAGVACCKYDYLLPICLPDKRLFFKT